MMRRISATKPSVSYSISARIVFWWAPGRSAVVELLDQKPLGTDAVERLQQKQAKGGIEPNKGMIRQFPDPPQRMTAGSRCAPGGLASGLGTGLFSRRTGFSANS
jgi:hypothetical protein